MEPISGCTKSPYSPCCWPRRSPPPSRSPSSTSAIPAMQPTRPRAAGTETVARWPRRTRIGAYEITNAQYAEFLNAVADADPNALYNTRMGTSARGGITRSGGSGSYGYSVKAGHENKPVVFVSFYDALRFANWLHNGEPRARKARAPPRAAPTRSRPAAHRQLDHAQPRRTLLRAERERVVQGRLLRSGHGVLLGLPDGHRHVPHFVSAAPRDATSGNFWSGTYALTGSALLQRRIRLPHERRRVHAVGEPVRHLRPGRQRVGVGRDGRQQSEQSHHSRRRLGRSVELSLQDGLHRQRTVERVPRSDLPHRDGSGAGGCERPAPSLRSSCDR